MIEESFIDTTSDPPITHSALREFQHAVGLRICMSTQLTMYVSSRGPIYKTALPTMPKSNYVP